MLILRLKSNSNGSGSTNNQQTSGNISSAMYGIANVSLPLYAGNKIRYGIESSRFLSEAARLDVENNRQEVILNTINAYDNLLKAKLAVGLVKESLLSAQERSNQFSNLEKNGLLARNDLLKAQLQTSKVELALLDAENNWKLANIHMNIMLGFNEAIELVLDETGLQNIPELKSVEDYIQLGLQNRKDAAALALRKKAASTGVKSAKSGIYPSIALTGGYVAAYIPNFITITNAVNIGIGAQYSLSSLWKNNAKVQQAKAQETQVEVSQKILSDAIRLQIQQAFQNYLLSQKKIDVYKSAVTQAEENYRIVKNKYDNALANTTDLLDADVAKLQAKLDYAFATSDASVNYNKLLQTAGLLEFQLENK